MEWVPRIRFGGLLDIPDDEGETRSQGPVFGMGIDLLSENSPEVSRFDLVNMINQGRLPNAPGELLVTSELMSNLGIQLGDTVTQRPYHHHQRPPAQAVNYGLRPVL
ncbi:hypothetical protein [Reinekea sp. G2M2-21]|uniref:hypothetical protein n=1 Tax=Reinekea sp. G2M2-21 TaxID=2788942 RepID=UPI0018AA4234|nr:hypothetical protein [Reinekea sp. G2M2-21]